MNLENIKKQCLEAIDNHRDEIIKLGKDIYNNPELGFKEFKSTQLVSDLFEKHGMNVENNIAVTGCKITLNEHVEGPTIAVLGELDSVVCPEHKDSSNTGNIHACAHNIQVAGMAGAALGIIKSDIAKYLDGKIDFLAVPAEECIDIEFRQGLKNKGEISFFGGKQELLRRGYFDNVDMAMMFHSLNFEDNKNCVIKSYTNGFISKQATFEGVGAHAGIAPHLGVNALNAATLAINNINSQRETFKDEDKVRVSTIITHGGDIVNIVPSKVRMEIMVRASNVEAMMDANKKINRCLQAGALAVGGKVTIDDCIGYLPMDSDNNMDKLFKDNYVELMGSSDTIIDEIKAAGSTDFGDLSQIIPCSHTWVGGVSGNLHTETYKIDDEELAYIIPAKAMALTIIDLLYNKAEKGKIVIDNFKPKMNKEEYLEFMNKNTNTYVHDYFNL